MVVVVTVRDLRAVVGFGAAQHGESVGEGSDELVGGVLDRRRPAAGHELLELLGQILASDQLFHGLHFPMAGRRGFHSFLLWGINYSGVFAYR